MFRLIIAFIFALAFSGCAMLINEIDDQAAFDITSEPPDAAVKVVSGVNAGYVCQTPCRLSSEITDIPATFTISKAGYVEESLTVHKKINYLCLGNCLFPYAGCLTGAGDYFTGNIYKPREAAMHVRLKAE